MPKCIVIDATYKMNGHRMVLLNFVGTSNVYGETRNSLASFHIAGAWMDHESAAKYKWSVQQFRLLVFNGKTELPNVFVTDNDKNLRSALDDVLPESGKLLCYIHISRNFQKHGLSKLTSLYSTIKANNMARLKIRDLVAEIAISANTEEHFKQALKKYREYFSLGGRCTDGGVHAIQYLENMLKEKEHWVGLYANNYIHLNNRSSNRAESTHSSQKRYIQTSSGKLDLVTKKLDYWAKERPSLRKLKSEQESLKQSVRFISPEHEYKLGNFKGKVSKYAIDIIKQEMIASISNNCEYSDSCLCQVKGNFSLPCRHLLAKYDIIPLNILHRCWLNYET
ncbi:hypothetical protein RMCBS344292_08352 [Rhizopus microsporus]|nr:hypothetical protein RMCBS344292_08352 [Rhizopus microsporus]